MSKQPKQLWSAIALLVVAALLSGCGGGDGPPVCTSVTTPMCEHIAVQPPDTTPPVGLYRGVTSNGRAVTGLVFDDNSFYSIYSEINNPGVAGGAIQGTLRASGGTYTITDAVDVNLEGLGVKLAAVSGAYAQKQSINGKIVYPSGGQEVSFATNYSADYETRPSIAAISGTYAGAAGSSIGSERVTMQIDGTGTLSGRGASGCAFNGTIRLRASGNAYQVAITFGGAPCRFSGASASGPAYFDRAAGFAYTILSLPGTNDKFIGIGAKQ